MRVVSVCTSRRATIGGHSQNRRDAMDCSIAVRVVPFRAKEPIREGGERKRAPPPLAASLAPWSHGPRSEASRSDVNDQDAETRGEHMPKSITQSRLVAAGAFALLLLATGEHAVAKVEGDTAAPSTT